MQSSLLSHPGENGGRVTSLELFFDLVFVFTITQVSHLVLHAHDPFEIGRAFLVLAIVWWMYGGYAWLTNNVDTSVPVNRILILTSMAGFLVMALAIPEAFGRDGLAFGLAYLFVNVIHAVLFTRARNESSARAIWRIAPLNIGVSLIIIVASFVSPEWNWTLWLLGALCFVFVPNFLGIRGFVIEPAHFAERHGLVLLIALGESIVSIGVGAGGQPVTPDLVIAAVLALGLSAALWWSYFDRDERLAEHALRSVPAAERSRVALYAYDYSILIMIWGVVLLAAGISLLIEHLHEPTELLTAALLAGGVAFYLLGDVVFRRLLHIEWNGLRVGLMFLALATIPIGLWIGGLVQVAVLVLLFAVTLGIEHARLKKARSAAHA